MLKLMFIQGSLHICLLRDGPQGSVPIASAVLLEFQAHHDNNFPRPSFDLRHLLELRTTIHPRHGDILMNGDAIPSIWDHDELMHLDNLEILRIGIRLDGNNSFRTSTERADFLRDFSLQWDPYLASRFLNGLERGFEPLRKCDRPYELDITVNDFPLGDVLCGWKERMAAEEGEEGVEGAEEGTEISEGSHEDLPDSG